MPQVSNPECLARAFDFKGNPVRTVLDKNGDLWFVSVDVCTVLDIANPRDAVAKLDQDEKNTVAISDGIAGNPNKTVVSESGLYNLIFSSRKPEAKTFRRWVVHEVLPSIRKTGSYTVTRPQTYVEALRALAAEVEEKERLALENSKNAPMVEYYHTVASSDDTITIGSAAKLLKLGRNRLMTLMRAEGILTEDNVPYQRFLDRKLFRVVKSTWKDSKGRSHLTLSTRCYARGVEFLRRKFLVRPTLEVA